MTACERIALSWGKQGNQVIEACRKATPFNDTFEGFLKHCTACGGNWGGLLLTGISELWPEVFDAIPDNMGCNSFLKLIDVLILCGVEIEDTDV